MIVYLIRNTVNGKGYVGQTIKSFEERWARHVCDAKAGIDRPLARAIRKYGEDVFEHTILAEAHSLDELSALEIYHIKFQNTLCPNGYNLTVGGEGTRGFACSPERRAKISAAQKGKPRPLEGIAKMAETKRRKDLIPEEIVRLYTVDGLTLAEIGKLLNANPSCIFNKLKKQGVALRPRGLPKGSKGTPHTPEMRAWMSASRKGRVASPETRKKLSASMFERWRNKNA
jgi:group I intron endonuclease